jgi:hypothetical protein
MSDYLRKKWLELDARKAISAEREAAGLAPLNEAATLAGVEVRIAPPLPPPAVPPAETTDAAREARRRGVAAAIARGEEPAGRFEGIASALPPSVQAAADLPIERLKILKTLLPESLPRKTPMGGFMNRVRDVIPTLVGRGVSARCLEATAEALVVLEKARGFTWAGLKGIATVAKYCARHIQRATRLLEGAGLFQVMSVPYRDGDNWWRDANIYIATMDEEPVPLPADVEGADPVPPPPAFRALTGGARLAALFGLVLRDGGLSRPPAPKNRTRPAPA